MSSTAFPVKKNSLCLFVLLSSFYSFTADVTFSFTPFRETLRGEIQEYSWSTGTGNNLDYMLSELLWDVDAIWTAGLDFSAHINNFVIGGTFSLGLPKESGKIKDSDWLNGVQSQKTHYSEHENYLRDYGNYEASFGYVFEIAEEWEVIPFLSITHRQIAFDSKNGWYDYPNTDVPPYTEVGSGVDRITDTLEGKAISYEQYLQYLSIGAEATYTIPKKAQFSADISFLPLVIGTARDDHWKRKLEILEMMFGGYGVSGNISGSLFIGKNISLNAGLGGTYITNLKGFAFTQSQENLQSDVSKELFERLEKKYTNPINFLFYMVELLRYGEISAFYFGPGTGQMLFTTNLSVTFSW